MGCSFQHKSRCISKKSQLQSYVTARNGVIKTMIQQYNNFVRRKKDVSITRDGITSDTSAEWVFSKRKLITMCSKARRAKSPRATCRTSLVKTSLIDVYRLSWVLFVHGRSTKWGSSVRFKIQVSSTEMFWDTRRFLSFFGVKEPTCKNPLRTNAIHKYCWIEVHRNVFFLPRDDLYVTNNRIHTAKGIYTSTTGEKYGFQMIRPFDDTTESEEEKGVPPSESWDDGSVLSKCHRVPYTAIGSFKHYDRSCRFRQIGIAKRM